MKKETILLKIAIILIAIPILILCIFVLPHIPRELKDDYSNFVYMPLLIGSYAAAIPFFFALFQAFKLLSYIDKNNAFSNLSVNSLKNIKYCALVIGLIYGVCLPSFYTIADKEDAPGIMLIGLVFTFAPLVVSVFAAILQKLLKNAINMKLENDLTV